MVQLHFGVKQLNISKTMGVYSKTMGVYIHFCGTMYNVLTWRVFTEIVTIILCLSYDTGLIIVINMQ